MKWIKVTTDAPLFDLFKGRWTIHYGYRERVMWAWLYRKRKKRELIFAKLIHREHDNDRGPGHIEIENSMYSLAAYNYVMPVEMRKPELPGKDT